MAALVREAFSDLDVQINKGFSSLGELLKVKNYATWDDNTSAISDYESDDHLHGGGSEREFDEPACKKQKMTIEIHENLASIVQNSLKDKPEEDRPNQIKNVRN